MREWTNSVHVCLSENMCSDSRLLYDRRLFGVRVHTHARAHTRHPSTSPRLVRWPLLCYFYPRAAVSVSRSERRAEVRASLITYTHTRTRTHTPFPVLSFTPPSLSLFPKIATSRDQLVLERGRGVCARVCVRASVGLMYYCLESEEGLWIDTNSHPRQANPGAGWINVLLFLGAPCFQGRPNDAMTSMRVNRRLEELSGFHLGLLQYFLQKGWRRVQNGSGYPSPKPKERGKADGIADPEVNEKAAARMIKEASRRHNPRSLGGSTGGVYERMLFTPRPVCARDHTCRWLVEYSYPDLLLFNVSFDGQFRLFLPGVMRVRARIVLALHVVSRCPPHRVLFYLHFHDSFLFLPRGLYTTSTCSRRSILEAQR